MPLRTVIRLSWREAGMTEVVRAAAGRGHGGQRPPGAEVEGEAGLERDVAILGAYLAAQPADIDGVVFADKPSVRGPAACQALRAAAGQPGRLVAAMIRRG
jgi:hypothetical protein